MELLLGNVSSVFTLVIGFVGQIVTMVVGQPLLLIPVAMGIVASVIGLAKKFL